MDKVVGHRLVLKNNNETLIIEAFNDSGPRMTIINEFGRNDFVWFSWELLFGLSNYELNKVLIDHIEYLEKSIRS